MSSNGRIDYYFWHMSDWAYFGHPRLEQIADRQGVSIEYMPVDLPYVYTKTGGILLPLRAKERQDYRFFELKRFRGQLGIPDGRTLVRDAGAEDVKAEYRRYTEEAIGRGVFGSPFYFFEGERFWGQDRLEQLERAIEKARWEKKRVAAGIQAGR